MPDTPRPPADPGLRDAIINAISQHAQACQDVECDWCDDAFRRADAVLEVVAEYLGTPLADLARRMRQRARDGDGGADAAALGEFADELNREVARPVAAIGGD
jgi:shikimate 5-dehydrogenase